MQQLKVMGIEITKDRGATGDRRRLIHIRRT